MFQPYASSRFMDTAGRIPLVGTVTGTARLCFGTTKFLTNGTLALINKVAHKRFGHEPWEASKDGAKAILRGIVEMIPGFMNLVWSHQYDFNIKTKLYKQKDGSYLILSASNFSPELAKFRNKAIYRGELKNGYPFGTGVIEYKDGSKYEGVFTDDLPFFTMTGHGKMTFSNGSSYEGDWEDSYFHGRGKKIYPDGSIYEGDWVCGARCGQGVMTYPNDEKYEGEWSESRWSNKRNIDKGKYTYADGSTYEGEFFRGDLYGIGTMTEKDGSKIQGRWKKNLLEGECLYTDAKGKKSFQTWSKGKRVPE